MTSALAPAPGLHIDLDLIRRYDRPGPRYTSYPTAPHFHEGFGRDRFLEHVAGTNGPGAREELALYLHLPFCRSLCWYCGCHMMVTHRPEPIAEYLDHLKREIDVMARRIAPERQVVQMHWGGGTPTYLSAEQIADLGAHLRDRFRFSETAEVSLEADPRHLGGDLLAAARQAGFNRISLGVQDFDPAVQQAINRIQPEELVARAVRESRLAGFESLNIDLIYGLPRQSLRGFDETIGRTIALAPDRIALFGYAHVPWLKKHQQLIRTDELPAPEERLLLLKHSIERLTGEGGYRYIGMDHFARPDDELALAQDRGELHRNFQGYSTRAGADLYAFGISGISQLGPVYAQNVKELPAYYAAVSAGEPAVYRGYRLTADDEIRRHVIMRLMCDFRLDLPAVEERFGLRFRDYFADALAQLEAPREDGLVEIDAGELRVTPRGQLLIRNLAMCFDRYLDPAPRPAARPAYSRTV